MALWPSGAATQADDARPPPVAAAAPSFPMNAYAYLAIAIAAELAATSALKASNGFSRLVPSIVVVLGYALAFYFLSLALRTVPVGVAYAIWSGAGIAVISVIGWLFFKESLDFAAIVGIGLIVSGVVVLNFFSNSTAH